MERKCSKCYSTYLEKKHVNTKGIHLLINGKKFLVQQGNLQDECDIRGYTGNYGKNENYINELIVPIFEMFLMCDEGTTIGYEIVKGNCIPIKKDVFYNEQQMQLIKYVQKGILSFQKKYFELKHQKGDILSIAPEEVLKIAGRLMRYPTRKEAKLIGAMQYDQNFGIDEKWQIINEKKLEEYQLLGYTQFVYQGKNREDEWYYGMDACIDGLQNYKTIMFSKRYIRQYEYCLFVERICKQTEKFVLIGAGDHLCDILAFLNILGETERVEMVCDSNRFLQEIEICGYKIVPLEQKSQSNCFVITAYDKKVINEIKKVLKEIHGEEIVIFHI